MYSTIQACHNAASSGDICLITQGTYTEMVSVSRVGITFVGQSFQTATVIGGFNIQRAATGTTVKDLKITSLNTQATAYPIYIAADSAKIYDNYFYDIWGPSTVIYSGPYSGSTQSNGGHIKGNKLFNVRRGFWIMGNNYIFENNELDGLIGYNNTNCPLTNPDGTEANCGCDYMWFHGNNMIIRNNYFHGALKIKTGGSHIDCFQTAADIPAWNTFNTLFENNTCINFDHFILWDNRNNQMGNWTIRNNLAVQNDPTRDSSWAEIYNKDTAGIKIEHNTIGGYTRGPAIWFEDNSAYAWSPSGSIKYNILFRSAQPYRMNFNCGTACDIGYNIFWNTGAATPTVSTNIVANPLFVDEANGNYHLQPDSPACNIDGTYAGAFPCDTPNNFHVADTNRDGCVSLGEISSYVSLWLSGNGVTLTQVSDGVNEWMNGC
jgi:hypothetical protein